VNTERRLRLETDDPLKKGSTSWCAFPQDAQYFNPSAKPFMINYRVENLVALVDELKRTTGTLLMKLPDIRFLTFSLV
jgi:hypothetical protein